MNRDIQFLNIEWRTPYSLTTKHRYVVYTIDQPRKFQNAPVPYPTMLHSEQKCAQFCSEWSIVEYRAGALWELEISLIWLYTNETFLLYWRSKCCINFVYVNFETVVSELLILDLWIMA